MKKLKEDMVVVTSNLTVMADMMSQLDPVTAKHTDVELLQQLYVVCKEMQDRIVELVPKLNEEKLIQELLAANDEMNTTFTRYQRFERQMTNGQTTTQKFPTYVNISGLSTMSVNQSGIAAVPTNCGYAQSTVDGVSGQFAKLSARETDFTFVPQRNVSHSQQKSEQSEGATDGLAQAQNSSLQNLGTIPLSQANVMDDIEKWLDFDDEDGDFEDGVTSEEFDRFLAERAKAADRLPTINAPWQDSNGPGS